MGRLGRAGKPGEDGLAAAEGERERGGDQDRGRDRQPPAGAEDARQPGRMAGGEEALEELLAGVDRDQPGGGGQPDASGGDGLGLGARPPRRGGAAEEPAERGRRHEDDPRREGMQIGVALLGEERAGVAAERQQVAQLMDRERRGRDEQCAASPHRTGTLTFATYSSNAETRAETASVQVPRRGSVAWAAT
ncbi:MAG: hypothetical protein QOI80_1374 [Solirubrobacteraceae bacterium]|nr:hypothetical protein [Solirubrobacteraceae bacterium]